VMPAPLVQHGAALEPRHDKLTLPWTQLSSTQARGSAGCGTPLTPQ
jgi:hypothetical protein